MGGLSKHMSKMTESILDPSIPDPTHAPTQIKKISTATGALAHFSKDHDALKVEVDRLKKTQGLPATIPLSELHRSPFQTRPINENTVAELEANLSANPLSTPVTVRLISPGYYELIAGHHRVEAFKNLGRTEILASVLSLTDDEAERLVFYDNLLAPQYSDFEKYLGFLRLKSSRGLTIDQLAIESGLSKTLITYVMAFDRLPEEVLTVIKKYPAVVGANMAAKLAALPTHLASRIAEAIELISTSQLTQTKAMAWILDQKKPIKPKPTLITSGRLKYADVYRRESQLTIKFTSAEDAIETEKALIAFIKERAARTVR